MSTFCQRLYHRKCQPKGVGGQKSQNIVNVVCERLLTALCFITNTVLEKLEYHFQINHITLILDSLEFFWYCLRFQKKMFCCLFFQTLNSLKIRCL